MTIGPFARDELAGGRLVYPFRLSVPHRYWWALACKSADKLLPKVKLFHDWVLEQIEQDNDIEAGAGKAQQEKVGT